MAFEIPNTVNSFDFQNLLKHVTSISAIENKTGLVFFPEYTGENISKLKSKQVSQLWETGPSTIVDNWRLPYTDKIKNIDYELNLNIDLRTESMTQESWNYFNASSSVTFTGRLNQHYIIFNVKDITLLAPPTWNSREITQYYFILG